MQENYLAQLQDLIKVQKMWFYFVCWGIFCKGYKEQFYNVEICNAADAYHGRGALFRDPCRTNTQIPDPWGGITLLTVCWAFDMPVEWMQLMLNKGSHWGMLNILTAPPHQGRTQL